jgi:pimeloyl-ACP methyl ester carboxylesterase
MGDAAHALATCGWVPAPTHIELVKHTADARSYATQIAFERHAHSSRRVILAGHSFGGWFVIEVATELEAFGVPVHAVILADAVDKDGSDGRQIRVPGNVRNLYSWRQSHLFGPKGSELIWTAATRVMVNARVNGRHSRVDENPALQRTIIQLATMPLAD